MLIPVRVDNRLRVPRDALPADVVDRLCSAFTYDDPGYEKLARLARRDRRLGWRLKGMPPRIATWADDGPCLTLPRGGMGRLRVALAEAGLAWRVEDARTLGTLPWYRRLLQHRPAPGEPLGGALRWYQAEAVEAGLDRQNCILRAPTGAGKTTSAVALALAAGVPALVVVWSGGLFEQWMARLRNELDLRDDDIGRVRGGERHLRGITIAMQQTLWRGMDQDFVEKWGMVICDEVQRAAARTFLEVLDRFPAKYRIGISADESRADGKEFLTYDLFGEVAHDVSQDDLIAEGAVLDVECRVVPTDFRADWYVAERERGVPPDFNRLLGEMERDDERNALALSLALAETRAGHQVLVLSHRVEHCQRFDASLAAEGVPSEVMLGGDEWRARFDAAREGLASGALRAVAGTIQAVGTGIDIPSLARGVLTTPVGSNRQLYGQIRGRLSRPGKDDAVLYVLWDRHVQGKSPLRHMLRWNRTVLVRADDGSWTDGHDYFRRLYGSAATETA